MSNHTSTDADLPMQASATDFRDEDIPLKDDVHLLGKMLGETLIKIEGLAFFHRLERVRQAALERRDDNGDSDDRLMTMLSGLDADTGSKLARAFSAYFSLVNMAERIHTIRQHRRRLEKNEIAEDSYVAVLQTLKDSGLGIDALSAILKDLEFTPVFTAHPTESVRRTLLAKDVRMAEALVERIEPERMASYEYEIALNKVRHEIGVAWLTDELSDQPSVADEVDHVMFFSTEVIYRIIPAVYRRLSEAVTKVYGSDPVSGQAHRIIRFATWVGGDMDGNPNVTAATIRHTLQHQRAGIVKRYQSDLDMLFGHLSQSEHLITISAELSDKLAEYQKQLATAYDDVPERYRKMPYRLMLRFMRARLTALLNADDNADGYRDAEQWLDDLTILADSLKLNGGTGLYLVERLIRRVETFGFHLATLDIRQDSSVHQSAVAQALDDAEFVNLSRIQRAERLDALLHQPTIESAIEPAPDSELERCLEVFRTLKQCRDRYGEQAIGPYIISMAKGPDDALAILYLARLAGLTDADGQVPLDIAPLFETVEDLQHSAQTLTSLLQNPLYRRHLKGRDDNQTVMLGYSDSSKESGLAASRWALYSGQQALIAAADLAPNNPVELTLFHGRGGTISRGGGHPRSGILAEPSGSTRGHLRVTEQGEIISQKYGLRDPALRTIEMMTGALLQRCALDEGNHRISPQWLEAVTHFAEQSRLSYRQMVYDNDEFIPYFRAATPIDVIERLRIGSRPPARRRDSNRIEHLRAIPWVFAWTQSRHLFTGWYGIGSGLKAMVERFGLEMAQEMAKNWRFFDNLIADVEMVLAKADMKIAEHYADLAGDIGSRIYPQLQDEFNTTTRCICQIQGEEQLLDREPALQLNIRLRDPYVDPLSMLQVDFLRRWRASERQDEALERALIITVKGIARGMQNTG